MKNPKTKYQITAGSLDDLKELITDIELKEQHIKNAKKALDSPYSNWGLSDHYNKLIAKYQNELKRLNNKFNNLRLKFLPILEQW